MVGVTAVLLYCCSTGLWVGVSVRLCIHEFVGYFIYFEVFRLFIFSRYTGPALAYFSVPLVVQRIAKAAVVMLESEGRLHDLCAHYSYSPSRTIRVSS